MESQKKQLVSLKKQLVSFRDLPQELLPIIFENLTDTNDLRNLACTNTYLYEFLCEDKNSVYLYYALIKQEIRVIECFISREIIDENTMVRGKRVKNYAPQEVEVYARITCGYSWLLTVTFNTNYNPIIF